jgi:hypothetical protein
MCSRKNRTTPYPIKNVASAAPRPCQWLYAAPTATARGTRSPASSSTGASRSMSGCGPVSTPSFARRSARSGSSIAAAGGIAIAKMERMTRRRRTVERSGIAGPLRSRDQAALGVGSGSPQRSRHRRMTPTARRDVTVFYAARMTIPRGNRVKAAGRSAHAASELRGVTQG